jgi:signal transduction histidine kinase
MMINDIPLLAAQVLFISLSIIAILEYIRHRGSRRRDFALMTLTLGFPFSVTFISRFYPLQSPFLNLIGAFAVFAQPYFLFRLLQYYRPSPPRVGLLIFGGFVLSCLLLLARWEGDRISTVTLIYSYCAAAEAYCTWGFFQGMRTTSGTLRRRLQIIILSSAVFTLAFIINVVKARFPEISPTVTPIAQIAAAVSAVLFYVAFVPPRWLRRAWQMEELYNYLLQQTRIDPASDKFVMKSFQQVSQGAAHVVNGIAGGVLNADESADKWAVLTATDPALFASLLENGQSLIKQAWQQRRALTSQLPGILDRDERRQLQTLGVRTWLLVPIESPDRFWGLLIVALKERSLFIDDDLSLLQLLARECALVLENHRLVDELQSYSGQLERRVEERTAALARSNEELRRYAYVASHDLQEPLRTVTSYLQLIEQRFPEKLDDEGREFIAFAVDGAKRMKNLINDLLMYSRVDSRARKFTKVNVQDVVDKTRKLLDVAVTESDATITHDPLPQIVADEELLLQLFQNLIGNAIKYRREEKPHIHIGAEQKDQQWTFSVRDNGIGIDEKFLERIFIIFQRLHTHDKYPGTGIGLAVCKKAVELHDGHIWAESEVGKGTTFHFTIPVREYVSLSKVS